MSDKDSSNRVVPAVKSFTWKRRLVRGVLLYAVVPYLALMLIFVTFQRRLIYQPTISDRLLAQKVTSSDVEVEDVEIHAANGLTLHGWRFHAKPTTDEKQKFLVIYFPGNAGCRRDRFADCRDFTKLGCDVVLFDYRGYGDNGGSPSEAFLATDARRVWLFATHDLRFPSTELSSSVSRWAARSPRDSRPSSLSSVILRPPSFSTRRLPRSDRQRLGTIPHFRFSTYCWTDSHPSNASPT